MERLRKAAEGSRGIEILGPAAAPLARIQERHRFQILIKAGSAGSLASLLREATVQSKGRTAAEVVVDIDPQTML